jgi:Predicted membrane protein (DUF2207)
MYKAVILTANPHATDQMRTLAWYGLAAVAAYYVVASLWLRWQRCRSVRVAQYDPPAGISPAVAAYLWERGVSDKPFVVALLNMASKGWLQIEQGPNDYLVSRGDPSAKLETEEQIIADDLFRGLTSEHYVGGKLISTIDAQTNSRCLSKLTTLGRTALSVRNSLEAAVEPELLSSHFACFVPGLTLSLWCFLAALYAALNGLQPSPQLMPIIMSAIVAAWILVAMVKTLPAIIYKLKSHWPGRTPHPLPLVKRDSIVLIMLLVALAALGVLAWLSSPIFAIQFGGFLLVNFAGMVALHAPTAAGRNVLAKLDDFRMFLDQVDSDRVNRTNVPTAPSAALDKNIAWALALDIEHAWGEQLTTAVLSHLQIASIEGRGPAQGPESPRAAAEIMDLHLR